MKYTINFDKPPQWGPMVKEREDGYFPCITEPVKCLIAAVKRSPDVTFIEEIKDEVRTLPAEFHPGCKVCNLVNWILMACPNESECYERLKQESLITLLEVNREIWTRIYPRPIFLSRMFMTFSERVDLGGFFYIPDFVKDPQQYLSTEMMIKRQFFYAWRNALSFLGHRSMFIRHPRSSRNGCYILNAMLTILQTLMVNKHWEIRPMKAHMPVYMSDCCLLFPDLKELIMKVAQIVGSSICAIELEADFWPTIVNEYKPKNFMFQDSDYYQKAVARCIAALFYLNNREIFKMNRDIRQSYIHLPGCEKGKYDACICKFARWLEKHYIKVLPTPL